MATFHIELTLTLPVDASWIPHLQASAYAAALSAVANSLRHSGAFQTPVLPLSPVPVAMPTKKRRLTPTEEKSVHLKGFVLPERF
jgi:hypothetical protein